MALVFGPVRLQKIVSFSSEDPLFPASNLLSQGKWRCKEAGEKAPWVMFQLAELSTITNIDIENSGSASIEVQVGRQGEDLSQMRVLLVATSFMSVNESRVGASRSRVRMFGPEDLEAEVAKQKWDLVKVVVTQPFNMTTKFGLNDIDIRGSNGKMTPLIEAVSTGLARDVLRLIAEGAEVNDKDGLGGTPLMCACETGNEEVVRVLLKFGAHMDDEDCEGETALLVAAGWGYCGVAR